VGLRQQLQFWAAGISCHNAETDTCCLNFYRSAEDYGRLLEAVNGVLNSDSLHACPEDTAGDTLPGTPDSQAASAQLPTMDET
jgi:hypothetical protein